MESLFSKLIWQQDNVLDEDFCKLLIDKFERDPNSKPGKTIGGINETVKKTKDLLITGLNYWNEQDLILYEILNKKIIEYNRYLTNINQYLLPSAGVIAHEIEDGGYNLQKYESNEENDGGYYTWHSDARLEKNRTRIITYIWYLNTVEHGGETEFIDGTIIKPKTGKLLMFPSTWEYVHCGRKPISNSKYICTGWIYLKLKD